MRTISQILILFTLTTLTFTLMPRQPAPHFMAQAVLPDLSFQQVQLSDYHGKYVVLLFYPFDFTYVCPTEIISYSASAEAFR